MAKPEANALIEKPGAWIDLALTLPLFLAYHAGVVFMTTQNATDPVTPALVQLAEGNRAVYLLITASIGVVFAGVFAWLGRGEAFRASKFVQVIAEGALYAVVMRAAGSYVVTQLVAGSMFSLADNKALGGAISSLGAGFYEELAFRVILFGVGAKLWVSLFAQQKFNAVKSGGARLTVRSLAVVAVWMLVAAAIFSAVHYTGAYADKFLLASFVYRMVLGVVLTLIYLTRGFSTAVWAHALYDIWVLVF